MWVLHKCILIVYMDDIYMCIDGVMWVLCTCILIVYMGAIYMYVDGVYGCYIHVC